jgi:hypothetical protein
MQDIRSARNPEELGALVPNISTQRLPLMPLFFCKILTHLKLAIHRWIIPKSSLAH